VGEDVVDVHTSGTKATKASGTVYASGAKLVVALALFGVAQHFVGLGGLLEFLFGLFIAGVAVGVVFDGHLLVGAFDFVGRGRLFHAEYLVIVFLFSHNVSLSFGFASPLLPSRPLLSHSHLGVADDGLAEHITRLHTVDDFALLAVFGGRHHGDSLVEVGVEERVGGVNLFEALAAERLVEFGEDEVDALFERLHVGGFAHIVLCTLEVVEHGKESFYHAASAVKDEFGLLFDGAFAEVFKLGSLTEQLVFERSDFGFGLFEFLCVSFFGLRFGGGFCLLSILLVGCLCIGRWGLFFGGGLFAQFVLIFFFFVVCHVLRVLGFITAIINANSVPIKPRHRVRPLEP